MATTNLNIRTDKDIKDQAEAIFNELGLNMTTAINMFLRTAIREHGIPFELKLDVPNETTAAESEEGQYGYGYTISVSRINITIHMYLTVRSGTRDIQTTGNTEQGTQKGCN